MNKLNNLAQSSIGLDNSSSSSSDDLPLSFEAIQQAFEEFDPSATSSDSCFKILEEEPNQSTQQEKLDKGAKIVQQLVDGASSLGQKDVSVFVGKKKADPGMPYTFVFWSKLKSALIQHNIKMNDFLVLATCAEHLEFGNKLNISQREIAEDLKISPPNISTSIKKLVNAGILIKEGTKLGIDWHFIAKGNLNGFIKSDAKAKHSNSLPSSVKIDEVNVDTLNIYMDKAPTASSKDTEQKESDDLPF